MYLLGQRVHIMGRARHKGQRTENDPKNTTKKTALKKKKLQGPTREGQQQRKDDNEKKKERAGRRKGSLREGTDGTDKTRKAT